MIDRKDVEAVERLIAARKYHAQEAQRIGDIFTAVGIDPDRLDEKWLEKFDRDDSCVAIYDRLIAKAGPPTAAEVAQSDARVGLSEAGAAVLKLIGSGRLTDGSCPTLAIDTLRREWQRSKRRGRLDFVLAGLMRKGLIRRLSRWKYARTELSFNRGG